MAETLLHPPPATGTSRAEERAAPPRPRFRGPVLIGDLSAQICGRPVFLMHWDDPDG